MINAGAIRTCSMIRPDLPDADRFAYVQHTWQCLAGGTDLLATTACR
ncbi:hypothetical protein [Streptomyces melanogenes]|nr:hypothetical protein [Streptomyces melanogenes]